MKFFNKEKQIETTEQKKKGRAFLATNTGAIVPFEELRRREVAKSSKQLEQESQWFTSSDLASRPYNPETFLLLYESNTIFWRTVKQIAIDVAGIGWDLILREGAKENKAEYEKVNTLLRHPNKDQALRHLCNELIIDWGTIGDCAIEVIRNNKGEVAELHQLPTHTLWAHNDKTRYCQKRGTNAVWFKKFGLVGKNDQPITLSPKTGEPEDLPLEEAANEVIFYKNYYPKSDHYGAPNILPAVGDVLTYIGIRDFNLSFFENYGVPAYVVTLDGDWEDETPDTIRKFLNTEIKGSDNQHKTLVLEGPEGCKVTFEPVSVAIKEGSFRLYRALCREDMLAAYAMPPYRIGIPVVGTLGGNIAEELTQVYVQSTIEPLQTDIEDIFNLFIIEQGLNCQSYQLKFKDIDLRNEAKEIEMMNSAIEHGYMTPNRAIERMGPEWGKQYPGGDSYYMMSSLVSVGEDEEDD